MLAASVRVAPVVLSAIVVATGAALAKPITVDDGVQATRVVNNDLPPVAFSPNGKQLALTVYRGDLRSNTNVYSILLFRASQRNPTNGTRVVSLATRGNIQAISYVKFAGNTRLVFRCADGEIMRSICAYDIPNKRLYRVVRAVGEISAFDMSADGDELLYSVKVPKTDAEVRSWHDAGFTVPSSFSFVNYVEMLQRDPWSNPRVQLRVLSLRNHHEDLIYDTAGRPHFDIRYATAEMYQLFMSPSGRYAVGYCYQPLSVPESWHWFSSAFVSYYLSINSPPPTLGLIEVNSKKVTPLVDSPLDIPTLLSNVAWSPDERILAVTTLMPKSSKSDKDTIGLLVVNRDSGLTTMIAPGSQWKAVAWIGSHELVAQNAEMLVWFRRAGLNWARVREVQMKLSATGSIVPGSLSTNGRVVAGLVESAKAAPELYSQDIGATSATRLTELNPQLRDATYGDISRTSIALSDGEHVSVVTILPTGYKTARRYPVVIATHGISYPWVLDGYHRTAFPLQPLANNGIAVVMLDDISTPDVRREGDLFIELLEKTIGRLDHNGLIQSDKIGIIGFSHTGYLTEYALIKKPSLFAAASVADNVDYGYFQYVLDYPSSKAAWSLYDNGLPYGNSVSQFWAHALPLQAAAINTPLHMEGDSGTIGALEEWEFFIGLRQLSKPVELTLYPGGSHELAIPSQREASLSSNLDWFLFWLEGRRSSNPAKQNEYRRWAQMAAAMKKVNR